MSRNFRSWALPKTRREKMLEPSFRHELMNFSAKSRTRNRIWGLRASAVKRNSSLESPNLRELSESETQRSVNLKVNWRHSESNFE